MKKKTHDNHAQTKTTKATTTTNITNNEAEQSRQAGSEVLPDKTAQEREVWGERRYLGAPRLL